MISLCLLADKKVSVQFDEKEIAILPPKNECSLDELEKVFNEVLKYSGGDWE